MEIAKQQMQANRRARTDMQKGVTMIEYALIAALVAVAAVTVLPTVGDNIKAKFTEVANKLS